MAGPRNEAPAWLGIFEALAHWAAEHEAELEALGVWSRVQSACRDTGLYAPLHWDAWQRIAEKERAGRLDRCAMADLITSTYAPGGSGFDALEEALTSADQLQPRESEVAEVIASLVDGRHYVTVCGALPLVEFALATAAGKWRDARAYDTSRVWDSYLDDLSAEQLEALFLEATAVEMVVNVLPGLWANRRLDVGELAQDLNRHSALHGTGVGWDTQTNAMRAVLLLAATARVAVPLLGAAQPS